MAECKPVPVKINLLLNNYPLDHIEDWKDIIQTLETLYCNNIIPQKGYHLADETGEEYEIIGISYSYKLNKGDSFINVIINIHHII